MKRSFPRLGGQLGVACFVIGILIIALAWNGAAGVDFVQGQVPYLLSGGAIGIALCILGGALLVVQNGRRDRSVLEAQLTELNTAVARLANAVSSLAVGATNGGSTRPDAGASGAGGSGAGGSGAGGSGAATVVIGRSSFHRPGCRLVAGKDLPVTSGAAAMSDGLAPCRICQPLDEVEEPAPAGAGPASGRRRR